MQGHRPGGGLEPIVVAHPAKDVAMTRLARLTSRSASQGETSCPAAL